ncbi:hypothetical protein H5P28_05145 [Ruficoccus amylovorans]|uniref:Uncharacterized protein n=1 Tax=Ruficoccus amylovorans TaxID=1804625 RepID=A0A842HAZ0_9BACT|nr:hypothetical protein [Ruficoccus amylovorans]MBC2593643.1 hypothetical protein [Ruficoccus amylovorans]
MRARLQPLLLTLLLLATAAAPARAISGNQPGVFAFGGIGFSGATSPGELKFREIMTSDDPEAGFRAWFRDGGNVGKAYALVALYYLDPERYEMSKARFADQHLQVPTMEGCSVSTLNYEQLTENIEAGRYDSTLKRFLPEHVREEHFPAPAEGAFALHPANTSAAQIELSTDETAFRQILASDDPIDGLSIWATGGSPVQRAYGLLGLYYLAPELYQPLKTRYADDTTTFIVFTDGESAPLNTGDFIALIETDRYQQDLATLLRPQHAPQGDKATLFATPNCCPADASAAKADVPSPSGCACPSCACSDCSCGDGDGKSAAPVPAP